MPTELKLMSVNVLDNQDGLPYDHDEIRLVIVLDGRPVRHLNFKQGLGTHSFSDDDNVTAENLAGFRRPFRFWSLADLTVYEADYDVLVHSALDWDTDEWVQTVRLDHREDDNEIVGTNGDWTIRKIYIGKESPLSHLDVGRSDCSYQLTYAMRSFRPDVDTALFERIEQTRSTVSSAFLTQSHATGNFEVDKGDCKWICAIDGGGLRGIFPLRVLEQMERYYSRTCFEMFDMFAGTSTGSLIASALATEVPLRDVLAVYADPVTRRQIFQTNVRGQIHAFRFFDLDPDKEAKQNLDDARYLAFYEDLIESYVGEFKRLIHETAKKVMTPQYLKIGMKQILYQLLSDRSRGILDPYKLGECKKDILVTARDLERPDSTLFSAFHIPHEVYAQPEVALARAQARRFDTGHPEGYYPARTVDVVTGLYQDVLLKDAVEASASAPVYFSPRARFTDGGVGPYNNPSFIAAFEALNRSHIDTSENPVTLRRKYTPYKENGASKSGTVVWSFGTAYKIPGTRRMSLMSCNASSDFALMR